MHRGIVQRVDQAMRKLLIILIDLPSPGILGRGPHVVSGDAGALHHRQGGYQYDPGPGYDRSGRLHQPPSTPIAWPVTKAASSEARKEITAATSSGVPKRPTGIALARSLKPTSTSSPYSRRFVLIAREVRIGPGQTALTVIPNGARSKASDLVKPTIAAFDAA